MPIDLNRDENTQPRDNSEDETRRQERINWNKHRAEVENARLRPLRAHANSVLNDLLPKLSSGRKNLSFKSHVFNADIWDVINTTLLTFDNKEFETCFRAIKRYDETDYVRASKKQLDNFEINSPESLIVLRSLNQAIRRHVVDPRQISTLTISHLDERKDNAMHIAPMLSIVTTLSFKGGLVTPRMAEQVVAAKSVVPDPSIHTLEFENTLLKSKEAKTAFEKLLTAFIDIRCIKMFDVSFSNHHLCDFISAAFKHYSLIELSLQNTRLSDVELDHITACIRGNEIPIALKELYLTGNAHFSNAAMQHFAEAIRDHNATLTHIYVPFKNATLSAAMRRNEKYADENYSEKRTAAELSLTQMQKAFKDSPVSLIKAEAAEEKLFKEFKSNPIFHSDCLFPQRKKAEEFRQAVHNTLIAVPVHWMRLAKKQSAAADRERCLKNAELTVNKGLHTPAQRDEILLAVQELRRAPRIPGTGPDAPLATPASPGIVGPPASKSNPSIPGTGPAPETAGSVHSFHYRETPEMLLKKAEALLLAENVDEAVNVYRQLHAHPKFEIEHLNQAAKSVDVFLEKSSDQVKKDQLSEFFMKTMTTHQFRTVNRNPH